MKRIGLGLLATLLFAVMAIPALASNYTFTQSALNSDWKADRTFPTGGVTSVAAFGRSDVARLGIDNTNAASGTFYRTEGIKTVDAQNFGQSVHVDLYIDPAWEHTAVRAGFWVVGDDGAGARDDWFGILEFVNLEPSASGDSAQGDHTGWRYWESGVGWTNLPTPFAYGTWVTLGIDLDTDAGEYQYFINGNLVATAKGGENFIREMFLNSYNYGLDGFTNLNNDSYAAHWHGGLSSPTSKDECKKGGWQTLVRADGTGFNNQGDCVSYVNTGK